MDLSQVAHAHAEWKIKLRSAIMKQEAIDAATLGRDDACPFGKWLHGEGKAKYAGLKSYARCVETHAHFHAEAGKVGQAINAKNFDKASTMLDSGTPYAAASSAVGGAVLGLRKEAGL